MTAIALITTCLIGTVFATGTKRATFTFPEFQYKETSKNVSYCSEVIS
jgi:hypothetical protein